MNPTDKNRERAEKLVRKAWLHEEGQISAEVYVDVENTKILKRMVAYGLENIVKEVAQALDSKDQEHEHEVSELREAVCYPNSVGVECADHDNCCGDHVDAFDLCLANQKARKEGKG